MDDLLNRAVSVLERRFLLVSLLPTLIFGSGLCLLIALSSGMMREIVHWWGDLPASIQVAGLLGGLAVAWLAAGFLDGQLRRIVQLFEGYPLLRYTPRTAERAIEWHLEKRSAIQRSAMVTVEGLPDALVSEGSAAAALPEDVELSDKDAAGFGEEYWVLYSGADGEVMPTRLGNVLRAAEDYAQDRYGADYLKIWPRLAHVCSMRFVQDYELARSSMEFLLVISFYSGAFGLVGGLVEIAFRVHPLIFLVTTVSSFVVCAVSYGSAVEAAKEYGEQMRASMDLYRTNLLAQLRYAPPSSLQDERRIWDEVDAYIATGRPRTTSYTTWVPPNSDSKNTTVAGGGKLAA